MDKVNNMDVQLISYGTRNSSDYPSITLSPLSCPKSLDEFDLNVFDISDVELWRYSANETNSIDALSDFISIKQMIYSKKKAKILFVLPRNVHYCYCRHKENGHTKYQYGIYLKDMLDNMESILSCILPIEKIYIFFENTRTDINGMHYEADFHFGSSQYGTSKSITFVTKSIRSEKITTISLGNDVYATTLSIVSSYEHFSNFITYLSGDNAKSAIPTWMEQYTFFDDLSQKEFIEISRSLIEGEEQKISQAKGKLDQNNRYKSILYTNGPELVEVVFEILEKILDYDLSDFIDQKQEDFLIRKPKCTFIGEIKGVTSNIRNEHISQTDVHYQKYIDELSDNDRNEVVHQLLIINPFRTKPITEREPVHEQQIDLARRNGCLIRVC